LFDQNQFFHALGLESGFLLSAAAAEQGERSNCRLWASANLCQGHALPVLVPGRLHHTASPRFEALILHGRSLTRCTGLTVTGEKASS